MELFHKHAVKPNTKSLREEPPDVKILCSLWYEFRVRNEILYCTSKEETDEWRLVIARDKQKEILSFLHDSNMAGHPGMSRMKLIVCSRFYWPCMRNDIENWVKFCWSCTMAKRGPRRQRAPLQQELNDSLFDRVAFDVIGPLPITVNGNRFILTMIDYFSKCAKACALPNHKAETVADCIVKQWIAHHGIPVRIHSDNAPEFRGHNITPLKKMLSMNGRFTTPYRPQSNGLCECMNQTIENIIKCTVREERTTWDKSLDLVMMSYRATPQISTGFTPNTLVTGKETNMPIDLIYGSPNSRRKLHNYDCYCSYVEDLRNSMVDAYFKTKTCLGDVANRQKMYYDRDTTPHHFKKGDWVIYWHKPTAMQTLSSGWTGPFVVTGKVSVVDYRIQLNLT